MADKNKRPGAGDIASGSYLGGSSTFERSFPKIEAIRFEYEETGRIAGSEPGFYDSDTRIITDKSRIGEYLPCRNGSCCHGGFDIGFVLRSAYRSSETECAGALYCNGFEGSKGCGKRYRDCHNAIKYKITILYIS